MTPTTPRHCAPTCKNCGNKNCGYASDVICGDWIPEKTPAAQAPPASSEPQGYKTPDEPKASPRDFVFYRITGGIFEPELVTVEQADGAVHAYKRLAEMGHDPRKYDIMRIGKFSEFPDDYEK